MVPLSSFVLLPTCTGWRRPSGTLACQSVGSTLVPKGRRARSLCDRGNVRDPEALCLLPWPPVITVQRHCDLSANPLCQGS